MKTILNFLPIILLGGVSALSVGCAAKVGMVSDSQTPGMTKMFYEVEVNAPKAEVWKLLADFDNLSWTRSVTSARYLNEKREGIGMARHCDLESGGHIVERITRWREGNGFTYVVDDASDPISTESYATWNISGDERQSKVSFEVNYKLKYGIIGNAMNVVMVKRKFSNQIVKFMEEIKTHLENKV